MPARGQGKNYQGYKWCRRSTRYAIYWRDRCRKTGLLRCVWCNRKGTLDDVLGGRLRLSLDHLDPWSAGGTNDPSNLVTACLVCNARRGGDDYEATCVKVQFPWHAYRRVAKVRGLDLDRAKGRELAALVAMRPWRKPVLLFDRDPQVQVEVVVHPEDEGFAYNDVDWGELKVV